MNAPVLNAEARELALAGMGASRLRKEDARFIQGKGNYVDDIKMAGMLHMAIVRSTKRLHWLSLGCTLCSQLTT
jgi:aerobic carbon-monoxide dehydrogenase large subunit